MKRVDPAAKWKSMLVGFLIINVAVNYNTYKHNSYENFAS